MVLVVCSVVAADLQGVEGSGPIGQIKEART